MATGPTEIVTTVVLATMAVRLARPLWRVLTRPVGTVRAVATGQPHIVLTYDDGPDPSGTRAVADALARFGATATFFMLVPRARRHQRLVSDLIAAGHEVGLHGLDHTRLTRLPVREVRDRCRTGRDQLEQLTGEPVRWFRAPYGALQLPHWLAVRSAGLMPVAWGASPGDWQHLPEETLAERALRDSEAGKIVLAHDGYAGPADGADDGPAPQIDRGRLAELMLSGYADRGLVGRSLSDALDHGRARRWAWFLR